MTNYSDNKLNASADASVKMLKHALLTHGYDVQDVRQNKMALTADGIKIRVLHTLKLEQQAWLEKGFVAEHYDAYFVVAAEKNNLGVKWRFCSAEELARSLGTSAGEALDARKCVNTGVLTHRNVNKNAGRQWLPRLADRNSRTREREQELVAQYAC